MHDRVMIAGMQSSLLGLALANKFFPDPNVGLPSAISVSHPSSFLTSQGPKGPRVFLAVSNGTVFLSKFIYILSNTSNVLY